MLEWLAFVFLAGLIYFAGVDRGKILQRAEWSREGERRAEDSDRAAIEEIRRRFWVEVQMNRAGQSLATLQQAGVRSLNDRQIRALLRKLGEESAVRIPDADWQHLEDVDLQKLFHYALTRASLSGGPMVLAGFARQAKEDRADVLKAATT